MRATSAALAAALVLAIGAAAPPALAATDAKAFYEAAEQEFLIPGLNDFFVVQGIAYDARTDGFLVGGYMLDSGPDPVYLVDRASGELRKTVYLLDSEGGPQTSHAGGICVHGDYVYLAGSTESCLFAYSYDDIVEADDGAYATCLGRIALGTPDDGLRASWVTAVGDTLLVGEFNFNYLPFLQVSANPAYIDDEDEQYRARAALFALDDGPGSVLGVDPEPVALYYLPDKVQGFAFSGGKAYLSTSILVGRGRVLTFDLSAVEGVGDRELLGATVPAYALVGSAQTNEAVVLPMVEGVEVVAGRLYVVSESASVPYLYGRLLEAQWCYSVVLDFFEP